MNVLSKKKVILLVIALVAFLMATVLGFTYSKYINSQDVIGQASTAVWNFDGAISNTGDNTTKSISLAQTVSKDSIVSDRIAPGTSGNFKIIINASGSEVDVDYDVLLKNEESNKPANLYFTCEDLVNSKDEDGNLIKYYSLTDMLKVDNQTNRSNMSGSIDKDENKTPKEININWEWPYESTQDGKTQEELDVQDTNDSGIIDYNFTLNIIGKQAN